MDTIAPVAAAEGIQGVLAEIAGELGCAAIALFETGFTLHKMEVSDPQWTGMLYLVAAHADVAVSFQAGELLGFPAILDARLHRVLLDAICDNPAGLIESAAELPPLFAAGAPAATGACAAVAVSASFRSNVPSVALLFFRCRDAAARQVEGLRAAMPTAEANLTVPGGPGPGGPPRGSVTSRLLHLRERMELTATQRRFQFLTQLQQHFASALGEATIEAQAGRFNTLIEQNIGELAEHLNCPDVRVYLIADIEALGGGARPEGGAEGGAPLLYRLQWASRAGVPRFGIRDDDTGPIGWVLRRGERLAVHNRGWLAPRLAAVQRDYPGLLSMESFGRDENDTSVAIFGGVPEAANPDNCSESLLIYPIRVGNRQIGVIACNGRSKPPYVFHDWDEASLGIIGLAIGVAWLNVEHRRRAEADRELLMRAAVEINNFSRRVADMIRDNTVQEYEIYRAALDTADAIAGIEPRFSSVRIFDQGSSQFRFGPVSGAAWSRRDTAKSRQHGFRVSAGDPEYSRSAAERVFRSRAAAIVDVDHPPAAGWFRNTFPGEFRHAVYVPVFQRGVHDRLVAIIDIRSAAAAPFRPAIVHALQELAELLGTVLALTESQQLHAELDRELIRALRSQGLMIEDLTHQMLTPLRNALAQISALDSVLPWGGIPDQSHAPLRVAIAKARGQIARSYRVGLTGGLFRDLREQGYIRQPQGSKPMSLPVLQALLLKMVNDQQLITDADDDHQFVFQAAELRQTYRDDIVGDEGLLEQMVSNLLENADKYSLPQTIVTMRGRETADRSRFVLEVENYGYPIGQDERERIRRRGARGREAILRVPSGQGLGLWIVDEIVKSFGGVLDIIPAQHPKSPHRFLLLFPSRSGEGGRR